MLLGPMDYELWEIQSWIKNLVPRLPRSKHLEFQTKKGVLDTLKGITCAPRDVKVRAGTWGVVISKGIAAQTTHAWDKYIWLKMRYINI